MAIMEIPEDILPLLKCSKCEGLLSWDPVFLCPDGGGLCSACHSADPSVPVTRNTHYEAVARLLLFPCRNQAEGCADKLPFSDPAVHEEVCRHRQYACPVLGPSACAWSGSAVHILDHCQQEHPDRVVGNPVTLTHDITKPSSYIYLMQAFHLLFLLFTKVSHTTGKIYYSISFLGKSSEAENFKFTLSILRNEETVTKKKQVVPKGCLAFLEDSALKINLNNLIGILGGFTGTKFTVTLETLRKMFACIYCNCLVTQKEYCISEGWQCGYCAPEKINCRYSHRGCKYTSFEFKVTKHEDYFCNFATKCLACDKYVEDQLLIHHEEHHLSRLSGTAWRVEGKNIVRCLILSEYAKAFALYEWFDTCFDLFVMTDLTNVELSNSCCTITVTQVSTNQTRTYTPNAMYDGYDDWNVMVTNEDFPVWSDAFDLTVTLKEI